MRGRINGPMPNKDNVLEHRSTTTSADTVDPHSATWSVNSLKSTMSLPRPNRRYRITEPGQAAQQGSPSSQPSYVTDLTTFFSLAFELEVHLFSDSVHTEARPVRAGAGGSSIARHFRLEFDDLGISEDDTYNDGRPMRGGNLSKGQRIITKHVVIGSNDLLNDHLDVASVMRPLVLELRVLAHPPLRDHPNIIDLFGVAWEKESDRFDRLWPILVLEYAPGGNLAEYLSLNDHHITWPIWQKLLEDLASALFLLHKCGVIHADIKPENILVDMGKDGRPIAKVCDFGFAIIRSDYTKGPSHDPEIQLIGFTPKWMAPEVRSGRVRISQTPSIDVYALGLVAACVAIGGRDPFDIDEKDLDMEEVQEMKENEAVIPRIMKIVQAHEYGTTQANLISEVLRGTLASAPSKRPTADVIHSTLISFRSERQLDDSDSQKVECSWGSDEPDTDSDIEIPQPFEMEVDGVIGLFQPDPEPIDQLLLMPVGIQNAILLELKEKASNETTIKTHDQSLSGSEVAIRESAGASYLLSVMLLEGLGGSQNLPEAVKWLEASAKAGNTTAQFDLPRILSAYDLKFSRELQDLILSWVAKEAKAYQSRFALDTLEALDQPLFSSTLDEIDRRRRLCASLSGAWDSSWFEGLFNAYSELCGFMNHPIVENILDLKDVGSITVSIILADIPRFVAFLHDGFGSKKARALQDHGHGLRWVHLLANFGILEALKDMFDIPGVDVNAIDSSGRTALFFATLCGNTTTVDFLLDRGALAFVGSDDRGNTCLHCVTSFRRTDISRMTERLLNAGAEVNAQNRAGCTPLHLALMQMASATSNLSAAEALLRGGADPRITDEDGETALYWGIAHYQPEALELLLNAVKVKVSESYFLVLKANLFDGLLTVPRIDMASFAGSRLPESLDKTVRLLLDEATFEEYKRLPGNGGDSVCYAVGARGKFELMRSVYRCFPSVNLDEGEIEYNRPALQFAIRHNRRQTFEELLSLGANLFYQDNLGENALHAAATYAPELVEMVLHLSRKENFIDHMIHTTSVNGFTPFDKAVIAGQFSTASILVQCGTIVDEYRIIGGSGFRMTLLGHILSSPTISLLQVDFLLQFRPRCTVSEDYSTVFHALAERAQSVQNEASMDFEGDPTRLIIFDVLYRAYPDALFELDTKGRTALHIASRNVIFDLVVRLVKAGVDPMSKDRDGATALDYLHLVRKTQTVEARYFLLRRSFERKIDELEAWLETEMARSSSLLPLEPTYDR